MPKSWRSCSGGTIQKDLVDFLNTHCNHCSLNTNLEMVELFNSYLIFISMLYPRAVATRL